MFLTVSLHLIQDFNGRNLLNFCETADYKKYARSLLKLLFTPAEMSESILFDNPAYTRSGEDVSVERYKTSLLMFSKLLSRLLLKDTTQMEVDVMHPRYKSES